jgi:anti-anti-sigma regulatory factor
VNLHIQLSTEFGAFCANGEKAAAFRYARIDPFVHSHDQIILDFEGVRNMNSSFANALVANLVSQSPEILPKLHFANSNPRIRVSIESALALGIERLREKEKNGGFVIASSLK